MTTSTTRPALPAPLNAPSCPPAGPTSPGIARRAILGGAAALATGAAVNVAAVVTTKAAGPDPVLAAANPDPILELIERHRQCHQEHERAAIEVSRFEDGLPCKYSRDPKVRIGAYETGDIDRIELGGGKYSLTWTPNGKRKVFYANSVSDIERAAPRDLSEVDRASWIEARKAALKADEDRLLRARDKVGLTQLADASHVAWLRERDAAWDLATTPATTVAGLAALFAYSLEHGGTSELIHDDEWRELFDWTVSCALCALLGRPYPEMTDVVAELLSEGEDDEAETVAAA